MSAEEIIQLLAITGTVGVVLNPVISFLKRILKLEEGTQTQAKRRLKFVVSLITCLVGGILTAAMAGRLLYDTLINILLSTGIVFTAASVAYNLYWKGSDAEQRVEGK